MLSPFSRCSCRCLKKYLPVKAAMTMIAVPAIMDSDATAALRRWQSAESVSVLMLCPMASEVVSLRRSGVALGGVACEEGIICVVGENF